MRLDAHRMIGPHLLSEAALNQELTVFLCGPGYDDKSFAIRKTLRNAIARYPNVEVVLGEDLPNRRGRTRKADLQTLESEFAKQADFTCLMVESPGAIAELGTFSMDPDIRMRLYSLVPNEFYGAESYIARGPLSILAASHPNSVVYYNRSNPKEIVGAMDIPLLAHKFLKHRYFWQYRSITLHQRDLGSKSRKQYEKLMKPLLEEFQTRLVCMAIISLDEPSFPELISFLRLPPSEVTKALKRLFSEERIKKTAKGRYHSQYGYADSELQPFSTTQISKMRARLLAAT